MSGRGGVTTSEALAAMAEFGSVMRRERDNLRLAMGWPDPNPMPRRFHLFRRTR